MHRVDTPGSVAGRFQDGNPAVGQQATQLLADWHNDLQENVAHVIEQAGIALAKNDFTQLYDALTALIAGVVGTGGGSAPTTRNLAAAGLVTGGGTLAADRTFTVTAATVPEVAAQLLNNVAVTPAGLAGLISYTAGVLRIGPVILMIATGTANGNGTTIISLPDTFPNTVIDGWCNGGRSDTGEDQSLYVNGLGLSTASVFSAINSAVAVTVFVLGS